ncbi:TlpA family protein disulfide reductase [Pedobacter caeni]|uniref:Thiol-disulfide isomerase or thioredoxin n=1 Tax=Pedobacter caeni TaxID=288992 RepID=A0A1M5KXN4_9SPHI|nr:TlpA disulfide reductase family protein [Pedobacter caeni]SHG57496.1 Thiol-disulfide isomerase or thioredoxin [Pedobacter caeni]
MQKKKTIITLSIIMLFSLSWYAKAQTKQTMQSRIQSMAKETNPEKNVVSLHSIIRDFKLDTVNNAEDIDVLKGQVAISFLKAGAFLKFEVYLGLMSNKFNQTSYLNLAVGELLEGKINLDYAKVLAQRTVELYDSYKDDPSARPGSFPLEDWTRFMRMAAYPYYETYAEILHANGEDKTALFFEEKALKGIDLEDAMPSSVSLYTALLASQGQEDKAYEILLKMASVGKSSLNMSLQLRKLCVKKMGSDRTSVFLDSIQRNINNTYKVELAKKMMVNLEAPDFSLSDLSGKYVTLAGLKGKVVVLDFWATWCQPCIASMPAMEKISKAHPEVVFLFVATGENGKDAVKRIASYVKKTKFPVHVLMDIPLKGNQKLFQVACAYKVDGIPTKIVIDKKGKLRFSTKGYSSDAELINELEAMIAIASE